MSDKDALIDLMIQGEPTRFTRARTKVKEHRELIIGIVIGLVAGATAVYLTTKKSDDEILVVEGDVTFLNRFGTGGIMPRMVNNIHTHNTIINEEPVKRLSYIIKMGEKMWETQRECAEALGVSELHLSQYLNGKRDHLNGHTPERLGVRSE